MSYQCHNRGEFAPSVSVQDGWDTTWARRMVDMQFRLNPSCVYSTSQLGQKDRGCDGCKWRKGDSDVEMVEGTSGVAEPGNTVAAPSGNDADHE